MRWQADVRVSLRPGIADPEGQTITGGLRALGFDSVAEVRSGKLLQVVFDAAGPEEADLAVQGMCRRLLANPVIEVASWEIRREAEGDGVEDRR